MPDILIRGMEMPKKDELLCVNIHPNGDVTINLDLECTPIAHAIELPPHGDLIDRDAFIAEMKKNDTYQNWLFRKMLEKQPVVVPAESREE